MDAYAVGTIAFYTWHPMMVVESFRQIPGLSHIDVFHVRVSAVSLHALSEEVNSSEWPEQCADTIYIKAILASRIPFECDCTKLCHLTLPPIGSISQLLIIWFPYKPFPLAHLPHERQP
jgi:hypothetical protein